MSDESEKTANTESAWWRGCFGRDGFYILLLFSGLALFFKDALAGRRTLLWDAADYFYPYFFTVSEALREWRLPLWTPYLFTGFPTIANIEAQIFYPLNLLFLPFTSFTPYAVYLSIILHCLIAGVSMYFLAKRFTGSPRAGLLSAIAFMYSGFMIGHVQHVTMIEVMAWLPLAVLFLDQSIRERSWAMAVAAGLVLGVSILAGHPQTSHAMIFVLAMHGVFRGGGDCLQEKSWRPLRFSLAALGICLLAGALLAAVQLIPTWELTKAAVRGAPVSFQVAARSGQFSWYDLVTLFVPNYFGAVTQPYWGGLDISQSILSVGTVPLLFAGYAVVTGRRSREVIYCALFAAGSLLLALGEHGPLFRFFYGYVPGFNFFRSPAHTVFISSFFVALLAGYGFRDLGAGFKKTALIGVAILCVIIPLATLYGGRPPTGMLADAAKRNMVYGVAGFVGTVSLVTVTMLVGCRFSRFGAYVGGLLLAIAFGESYLQFSSAATSGIWAPPSYVERVPNRISQVRENAGIPSDNAPGTKLNASELSDALFRIYTRPEGGMGIAPFGFNRAMIHHTFLVEGFEPLELSRHRILVSTLSARNLGNLLKIQNVRYVSTLGAQGDSFEMIPPDEFLPRAFIVANARFLARDEQVLDALASSDPRREVIISGAGTDMSGPVIADGSWRAKVETYHDTRVRIRTTSAHDGFLVLSDTFYPGWTARVDGAETPVLRANYNFRAILLPKGDHHVEFDYFPKELVAGGVISLGSLLVCVIILARNLRSRSVAVAAWQRSRQ